MPAAVDGLRIVECPALMELRKQAGGPLDGAGHQLREETDVGEKCRDVAARLDVPAVHVDAVAQGLERIETDAHRQQDVERGPVGLETDAAEQQGQIFRKKVVVFEDAEDREVQDDVANGHPPASLPVVSESAYEQAARVAEEGGQDDQKQKPHIPPAVKDIAGSYQKKILPRQPFEYEPIKQEDYRQEEDEFQRIEKHNGRRCA